MSRKTDNCHRTFEIQSITLWYICLEKLYKQMYLLFSVSKLV